MHPPGSPRAAGLVLADKEPGISSFGVVRRVRARVGAKAGHAGTLDPFASGLLVCLVGRATRLARYLVGLDKRYVTEIRLGVRTATGDTEGEEIEATEPATLAAVEALRGEVDLRIPVASAVKVQGERAYRLHRRGVAVEMPARRSRIHELEILRFEPPELELSLRVSSGTYVRAIADALGGHCRSLRRTAVGPFRVEDADESVLLPPLAAVPFLARRELRQEETSRIRAGQAIEHPVDELVALTEAGELIAVGRAGRGNVRAEAVIG